MQVYLRLSVRLPTGVGNSKGDRRMLDGARGVHVQEPARGSRAGPEAWCRANQQPRDSRAGVIVTARKAIIGRLLAPATTISPPKKAQAPRMVTIEPASCQRTSMSRPISSTR